MTKFPSQNKLMYVQENGVSNDAWTGAQSGGAAGGLNLPKDLSLLNRRGYASTTSKGVPLIYRCKVDLFATNFDGTGTSAAVGTDFVTTLRAQGCQNNWVMRNAAVKWHAARASMWRQAGVKKSHRGAYTDEIRYCLDSASDTWIVPVDGDGAGFTGGTWDLTEINNGIDEDGFALKIIGTGTDEDAATTPSVVNIGHSYLQSRRQPDPDTNDGADSTPSDHSLLNATLFDVSDDGSASPKDDIVANAKGQGDNQPYEVFDGATTDHDITEPVELGRCIVGPGAQYASMIIDVPFGLANLYLQHYDAVDTNTTHNPMWTVEVLDIFEMQG